ncbi:hypothetical protein GCM10010123_35480 [Pilimelia anulata]|uniref:DUF6879 domain-containing protein n=1 Tax=Pilimelia anulata TaxID=53371 RepID=A0A8J3BDF5_9ACTN|nr:hypothetical protein GCM10010123_35480 [Pilimelia anulata]
MRDIDYAEFRERYRAIRHSWAHLELRDSYGTAVENGPFARWLRDGVADPGYLAEWCELLRGLAAAGRTLRRVKVVGNPPSEYHRWIRAIIQPVVDAGEATRWCDRRAVAAVALPGADFYVLDDETVLFPHFDGAGSPVGYSLTDAPETVDLCRTAFEACWAAGTDHDDGRPPARHRGAARPRCAAAPPAPDGRAHRPGARPTDRAALHPRIEDRERCAGAERPEHPRLVRRLRRG